MILRIQLWKVQTKVLFSSTIIRVDSLAPPDFPVFLFELKKELLRPELGWKD